MENFVSIAVYAHDCVYARIVVFFYLLWLRAACWTAGQADSTLYSALVVCVTFGHAKTVTAGLAKRFSRRLVLSGFSTVAVPWVLRNPQIPSHNFGERFYELLLHLRMCGVRRE
jgi:hypothetical protein